MEKNIKSTLVCIIVLSIIFVCSEFCLAETYYTTNPDTGVKEHNKIMFWTMSGIYSIDLPIEEKSIVEVKADKCYDLKIFRREKIYSSFIPDVDLIHEKIWPFDQSNSVNWLDIINPSPDYYYYLKIRGSGNLQVKIYPVHKLSVNGSSLCTITIYKNGNNIDTFYNNSSRECKAGDRIYLKATPDPGYSLIRWKGDLTGTSLTTPEFIITEDISVKAVIADVHVDDVTFPTIPIKSRVGGVDLFWNELSDPSNIIKYQIALTCTNSLPDNDPNKDGNKNDSNIILQDFFKKSQATITGLTSQQNYYVWVRAYDGAGNIGSWKKAGDFCPLPQKSDIDINGISKNDGGNAVYKVNLQLDNVNVDKYLIHKRVYPSGSWSYVGTYSYSSMVNRSFTITDTVNIKKHTTYQYKVITQNVKGQSSQALTSSSSTIPNIKPIFNIEGPADNIFSKVKDNIIDITSRTDVEGDNLKFKVHYTDGSLPYETVTFINYPTSVSFDTDGSWEWWLEILEVDGNGFTNKFTTPHRIIKIDTAKPSGTLKVLERNGTQEYSQTKPALTRQVDLKISELSDRAGLVDSGVKGVYLWNKSRPTETQYISISSITNPIAWELAEGTDGDRIVMMKIVDNAGNEKLVEKVLTLDTTPPHMPINFHHSPDTFLESDTQQTLTFSWAADSLDTDIAGFVGSYLKNGKEITLTESDISFVMEGNQAKGSVQIDVSDLGWNQQVKIKISAVDTAGNKSAETIYSGYTRARLGQISQLSGGYNKSTGQHYLSWQVTDSGEAANHVIEYGTPAATGFIKAGQILADNDGVLVHSGLTPHTKYNYRLVAINDSGDKTYSSSNFERKVPNVPPEPAKLIAPTGFERSEVVFDFNPAVEYDGDPVKYHIYFGEGSNPGSFEELDFISRGELVTRKGLAHNQQYTWYAVADDGMDITESEKITFTVYQSYIQQV